MVGIITSAAPFYSRMLGAASDSRAALTYGGPIQKRNSSALNWACALSGRKRSSAALLNGA